MYKEDLSYGLFLSDLQLDFLSNYPQGFDRMKCFASFLQLAVKEPTHYEKKEYSVDLTPGQIAISEGELAILWKCNRKTASKIVDMFHEVVLVSSVPNCRTSVFTVHCVASWYIVIRQSEIRITHVIIRLNNASRLTTKARMLLLTMIPMMSIVSVLYPFL